jgi:hypothetical protein
VELNEDKLTVSVVAILGESLCSTWEYAAHRFRFHDHLNMSGQLVVCEIVCC